MQIAPVAHKILDITHVLPCSQDERKEIKEMAIKISKRYLDELSTEDARYVIDVALSSVYLSSKRVGCHFSFSDLSKETGYSLISWTRIVKDMQLKSI